MNSNVIYKILDISDDDNNNQVLGNSIIHTQCKIKIWTEDKHADLDGLTKQLLNMLAQVTESTSTRSIKCVQKQF